MTIIQPFPIPKFYFALKKMLFILFMVLLTIFEFNVIAQGLPSGGAGRNEKDFSFLPIPYISYDRSLGFTAGMLPMAMYNLSKKDTLSPSSISGALGMYTTNDSWFVMQFNKFYFKEDRYRAVLVGGSGNINFQFFLDHPLSPGYIDYTTEADFFKVELQRRLVSKLYFGLNYIWIKTKTSLDVAPNQKQIVYLNGIGTILSHDVRDNVYYPRIGHVVNLKYTSYPEFLDNRFISNKIELDYNHFISIKNKRDILALRFYGGAGIGDLSFNQQFVVGNTDIRGYSQGKYRGNQTVAIQGEYRLNPFKKLGFVGFFGLASVFSAINEEDSGKLLPGIGTGFRYNVFPKNHMNVGIDIAAGIDDWGVYFRIGEAF